MAYMRPWCYSTCKLVKAGSENRIDLEGAELLQVLCAIDLVPDLGRLIFIAHAYFIIINVQ